MVDGTARVATRANALATAIATVGERFFEVNPFLLVYDYKKGRLMGVCAATLFAAFERETAVRTIPVSESSLFSLTPSFEKRAISMYATVQGSALWDSDISPEYLTPDSLIKALSDVREQTQSLKAEAPKIVSAIKKRIDSLPSASDAGPPDTQEQVSIIPIPEPNDIEDGDVRVDSRVWRMIITAIQSSPAVLLVGPPGTGKTALLRKAINELRSNVQFDGFYGISAPVWATPDESWSARELVGGDTVAQGAIEFRAGWVLRAIEQDRWLVLDEANRADMDRIFGGLLTWLSGGMVSLGLESTAPDARGIELGWKQGKSERIEVGRDPTVDGSVDRVRYLAGENWRLLGTYNALDAQRVFRFGAALGRRFLRIPIPAITPELFSEVLEERAADLSRKYVDAVKGLYSAHYAAEPTRLGPALFLAMCQYLLAADKGLSAAEVLAEAYLVHVGSSLAHLEDRDLLDLEQRVIESGAIDQREWTWITSMISALA